MQRPVYWAVTIWFLLLIIVKSRGIFAVILVIQNYLRLILFIHVCAYELRIAWHEVTQQEITS
ncbi:hypothetical protein ASF29_20490 [Rhizobium sp. Leaf262]|nr:hypothetical protein ASF29_20490 [Rhizobium sp. Leaf262]